MDLSSESLAPIPPHLRNHGSCSVIHRILLRLCTTEEQYKAMLNFVTLEHEMWQMEREIQERTQAPKRGILPRPMSFTVTVGLKTMKEEEWQMAAL